MIFYFSKASVKINSVPTPTVLTTSIVSLCACKISLVIESPRPEPFFVAAAGCIGFIKAVPDFIKTFLWNTGAVVLDGNIGFLTFFPHGNVNHRIFVAEFNCVVDKVVNNLSDFAFIGFDGTVSAEKVSWN